MSAINNKPAQVHKHTKRNKAQIMKEQKNTTEDEVRTDITSHTAFHPLTLHSGFARANSSTVDIIGNKNSTSTLIHETY